MVGRVWRGHKVDVASKEALTRLTTSNAKGMRTSRPLRSTLVGPVSAETGPLARFHVGVVQAFRPASWVSASEPARPLQPPAADPLATRDLMRYAAPD